MNELSPVFDKLPKFFDGQETITTMKERNKQKKNMKVVKYKEK